MVWRNPCGWSKACLRVLWCKSNSVVGLLFISEDCSYHTNQYHPAPHPSIWPGHVSWEGRTRGEFYGKGGREGEGKESGRKNKGRRSSPIPESRYKQEWMDYIGRRLEVKSFQLPSLVSSGSSVWFESVALFWSAASLTLLDMLDLLHLQDPFWIFRWRSEIAGSLDWIQTYNSWKLVGKVLI